MSRPRSAAHSRRDPDRHRPHWTMFAVEHEAPSPDIMATAKASAEASCPSAHIRLPTRCGRRRRQRRGVRPAHLDLRRQHARMAAGLKSSRSSSDQLADAARKGQGPQVRLQRIAERPSSSKTSAVEVYDRRGVLRTQGRQGAERGVPGILHSSAASERPRHHHRLHAQQPQRHPDRAAAHRQASRSSRCSRRSRPPRAITGSRARSRVWDGRCCSGAATSPGPAASRPGTSARRVRQTRRVGYYAAGAVSDPRSGGHDRMLPQPRPSTRSSSRSARRPRLSRPSTAAGDWPEPAPRFLGQGVAPTSVPRATSGSASMPRAPSSRRPAGPSRPTSRSRRPRRPAACA